MTGKRLGDLCMFKLVDPIAYKCTKFHIFWHTVRCY